jgi:RpiR family transcriptional regulator, carbohydrate utilization regulator
VCEVNDAGPGGTGLAIDAAKALVVSCLRAPADGMNFPPGRLGPSARGGREQAEFEAGAAIPRIRTQLPSLRPGDARVAREILKDPFAVIHLSVSDLASAASTSGSTVVRACQRMGFSGFHDLKLALARESGAGHSRTPADIEASDHPGVVRDKVAAANAAAIMDACETISAKQLGQAVDSLAAAGRILCAGVGTSAPLAQDAAYRMLMLGRRAEAPADVHVQHVAARLLDAGDACLVISHTGSTRETVGTAAAARAAGASTIAVTSFARSPLTQNVDIALVAGSRETHFRLEAMASRVAHLSIVDSLCVSLALKLGRETSTAMDAADNVIAQHRF